MKKTIVVLFSIFVLVAWTIPFIIYHLTDDSRSFIGFLLSLLISGIFIEWLDDKWKDL